MRDNLNAVDIISYVLLVIGGINWGLIGFFGFDLVAAIFGDMTAVSRVVYALVGISALYLLARTAAILGTEDDYITTGRTTVGRV